MSNTVEHTDEEWAAIARKMDGQWLIDFDGKNCEDCGGWDGESRRCSCGNRRVVWEFDRDSDGVLRAHGEAW